MFHDGHSDPTEGGILTRNKNRHQGEKKTQGMRASRKPGGEARAPAPDQLGERNGLGRAECDSN